MARLDAFSVTFVDGSFVLSAEEDLVPAALEYLQRRMDKFNRYKKIGVWKGNTALTLYYPPPESEPGKRSLVSRLERALRRARKPATVTMALSYDCQCNCTHCSAARHRDNPAQPLTTDEWKKQIDDSIDLGATTVVLTGGEPLLVPELTELVRHVDKHRATATLFTNGEFLSKELAERLAEAGLYGAFVSVDSSDPETHNQLRGRPGLFNKAIEGIRNLQEAGMLAGLSLCCTHSSLASGELDRLMNLARDLGVNEVSEFDALPTGRWLKSTDNLLTPGDHQMIQQKAAEYYKDSTYPPLFAASVVNSEHSVGCFAALTQCYITAFGDVCPCDFTPITFGNVRREKLEVIWSRMVRHPFWRRRSPTCRMQSKEFRDKAIDHITENQQLPIELECHNGNAID